MIVSTVGVLYCEHSRSTVIVTYTHPILLTALRAYTHLLYY
jgi:hypothetical protein